MRDESARWSAYYDATSARPPSPSLLDTIARFDAPGLAIDLGSGAGVDSMELLDRGWRVVAIDQESVALDRLRARVALAVRDRLETKAASFEDVTLPDADLVWSNLSLSFCRRESFDDLWNKIVGCLRPGGRVACDVFGERHAWSSEPGSYLTAGEVRTLLDPLEVESFAEEEAERPTVFEGMQHWHAFRFVARKI